MASTRLTFAEQLMRKYGYPVDVSPAEQKRRRVSPGLPGGSSSVADPAKPFMCILDEPGDAINALTGKDLFRRLTVLKQH